MEKKREEAELTATGKPFIVTHWKDCCTNQVSLDPVSRLTATVWLPTCMSMM